MTHSATYAGFIALVGTVGMAVGALGAPITIQTVTVAKSTPVNAADSTTYGSVGYAYNIGKYEVTAGQYTAFLNAVAGVDANGLYFDNPNNTADMANTTSGSGITRSHSGTVGDPYQYTVDPAFVNRPVNYVTFWNAARFANWMSNGQPTGAQNNTTTESGAYTITSAGITANNITRNANATWVVANENEWYKAAYYDPTTKTYSAYPTHSNTAPGDDTSEATNTGNNANTGVTSSNPVTTVAGDYQDSDSFYGTFDQGGNVWEWNEAVISTTHRGLRGSSWNFTTAGVKSNFRYDFDPTVANNSIGFRLVQLPEPASGMMLLGVAGMALVRRRRRSV